MNNLIIIFIGLLVFNSCDKFLDIQPTGKVIPKTGTEFRALLTEAYTYVPEDRGLTSFRSDEIVMNASLESQILNSYLDIWTWRDMDAEESTTSFNWRTFYHTLFIANYIIENQNSIEEASREDINQMVGEAYMLRAYMHFILVNLYGEPYTLGNAKSAKAIPLKLNSSVEETPFRNTVDEVYQSILSDLNNAGSFINKEVWDMGYTYRFNKLSINALRSRVYLYMGEWEKSLAASEAVLEIKNTLTDLSENILPNNYKSPEAIVSLEKILTDSYMDGCKVSTGLFKKYGSGDLRKTKYYKQETASNIKVLKGGSIEGTGNTEFRCTFRVGEIYLNASEAAFEMGESGTGKAKAYLLNLMKYRYSSSAYTNKENAVNAMNREELLQEIYDERFRELAFEGHRWFDLRRTTRPHLEKVYKNETFILEKDDSRYTVRIPNEAIAANPNLAN